MDKILVVDFGGQYNQLIARRVREQQVFAEIKPYDKLDMNAVKGGEYAGLIFTGGPNSVYASGAPVCGAEILETGVPILGICYGCQLLAFLGGGEICGAGSSGEYGKITLTRGESALFEGIEKESICWMSHMDYIKTVPEGFTVVATTASCPSAAMENAEKKLYGVQFHPEVTHTQCGKQLLHNFLFNICGCKGDWRMDDFAVSSIEKYKSSLAGKRVLCALSGGVDSSVAAALLHKAVGDRLCCIFVDHGLLRKDEGDMVEKIFKDRFDMKIIRVNAQQRFLSRLEGVTEPERKRKIIGEEFIRVFEEEAEKLGEINCLAQGTIYPDVIESGSGSASAIKSHHNVGGLPEHIKFTELVEPLRELFKDEVRKLGEELGLPHELVWRQPFPGPGLAVRILGEITEEKIKVLQSADAIFREETENAGLESNPSQYFAVLTADRSVGVMGDARTYGCTIALRAVTTDDFMTAEWTRLPFELLERASSRISNELPEVNRVVYDISSKPPATVEWE